MQGAAVKSISSHFSETLIGLSILPLRRRPAFRSELRGGTLVVDELSRFGQPMLERMEILARARAVKGDRCLDGASETGSLTAAAFPMAAETGATSCRQGPEGDAGRERPSVCCSAAEGSGQERARSIPSEDRGQSRAISSPNASAPRRQTTQIGSGGPEPRNRRHETLWPIRYLCWVRAIETPQRAISYEGGSTRSLLGRVSLGRHCGPAGRMGSCAFALEREARQAAEMSWKQETNGRPDKPFAEHERISQCHFTILPRRRS